MSFPSRSLLLLPGLRDATLSGKRGSISVAMVEICNCDVPARTVLPFSECQRKHQVRQRNRTEDSLPAFRAHLASPRLHRTLPNRLQFVPTILQSTFSCVEKSFRRERYRGLHRSLTLWSSSPFSGEGWRTSQCLRKRLWYYCPEMRH